MTKRKSAIKIVNYFRYLQHFLCYSKGSPKVDLNLYPMTHNLTNELFNSGNPSGHLPDPMTKVNPRLKILNYFLLFE